jgi:hypothetical protein
MQEENCQIMQQKELQMLRSCNVTERQIKIIKQI